MTPLPTRRPSPRPQAHGALTSPQLDELVGRLRQQAAGREREAVREEAIRALVPLAPRIAARGVRHKLTEVAEHMPGRHS